MGLNTYDVLHFTAEPKQHIDSYFQNLTDKKTAQATDHVKREMYSTYMHVANGPVFTFDRHVPV